MSLLLKPLLYGCCGYVGISSTIYSIGMLYTIINYGYNKRIYLIQNNEERLKWTYMNEDYRLFAKEIAKYALYWPLQVKKVIGYVYNFNYYKYKYKI